ncbi:MAG: hypothetical protein ROO76_11275 [Terriglobia bacterium]|nr:hypothetical protein [Terriglobia bacterium]
MKKSFTISSCIAVLALVLGVHCVAQVSLTDNLKLSSATANLGTGYTGSYGNIIQSSHNIDWNGTGNLSGFYYEPNFLSFSFQPYYDQSRANSNSQNIASSSGFNLSSAIFGGSRFPGSISYTKGFNSQGNFGVPGLPDFTTHGNSDALTVGWSALLPDLPSVTAQFQLTHSAYSIYGTNSDGTTAAKNFTVRSSYVWDGFNLNGGYSHSVSNSDVPLLLTDSEGTSTSDVSTDTWNFSAAHRLPLQGNLSTSFSRYSNNYDYFTGSTFNGDSSADTFTTTAALHPWSKVSVGGTVDFDDNLGGTVTQQILAAGGNAEQITPISGSHSLSMIGVVDYTPLDSLSLSGEIQRRVQTWLGTNFGVTSYTGIARFSHQLLGGGFSANMSGTGNREDNNPATVFGFSDSATYSRGIAGWNFGLGFGYSQNVQTLLVTYMTSTYNASGTVQHRFGPLYWSAGANTNRSGMTMQQGASSASNSYSTSLSAGKWFAASASYQESNGIAIQTIAGLTPPPIIPNPVLNPEAIVLYGGHSYAFAASTSPARRFAFAANYSRASSNTKSDTLNSMLSFEQIGVTTHYQWRQMYFVGGYSRFLQAISVSGVPAGNLNSFYIGVNRWFNWF